MNEIYAIYKDMGFDLMIDNNQYLSLYIIPPVTTNNYIILIFAYY